MNQIATLAAGCFWCTEAIFKDIKGVGSVVPGYAGGETDNPTYKEVSSGTTGHAEAVQIKFDSETISYDKLIELFFLTHDPTQLNRQGNDVGTQYRSAIYYHDAEQKQIAKQIKDKITQDNIYDNPLVTEITALGEFYEAEDYHHDYFEKNPNQPYCQAVINPKISKLRKRFSQYLK